MTQESKSKFHIEIDPSQIPNRSQAFQMMDQFSKLETCTGFQKTESGLVFRVEFPTRNKALKIFDKIAALLESE